MRKLRTAVLAAAGTSLVATTAAAATDKVHTMQVDLPDGSVAHIRYTGDVAPRVSFEPADARTIAIADPFAGMHAVFADFARISAMMQRQSLAMMQRMAEMQRQAGPGLAPGQIPVSGNLPAGAHVYSVVSTTTRSGDCVQTVEWRSDGTGSEPKMTRAASGDCDNVKMNAPIVQAAVSGAQPKASGGKVI